MRAVDPLGGNNEFEQLTDTPVCELFSLSGTSGNKIRSLEMLPAECLRNSDENQWFWFPFQ